MMPHQWSTDPGNLKTSQYVSGAVKTDHVLLLNRRVFCYFIVRSFQLVSVYLRALVHSVQTGISKGFVSLNEDF